MSVDYNVKISIYITNSVRFVARIVDNFKGMITINGENIRIFFIMVLPIVWVFIYNLETTDNDSNPKG